MRGKIGEFEQVIAWKNVELLSPHYHSQTPLHAACGDNITMCDRIK
jgi:hypothetical protein